MTRQIEPDWKCEECGERFSVPDNLEPGKKRFCSADCRAKNHYRLKRDAIRAKRKERYDSDPEHRMHEVVRAVENKKRRRAVR